MSSKHLSKKQKTAKEVNFDGDEEDNKDIGEIDRSVTCQDNHTSCVNDKIDALKEVFDEKTCLDLLRNYHQILNEVTLPPETRCDISGCEFDYSSNTYRLMIVLSAGSANIGENFVIVKIDGATGFPKILSVR